MASSVFLTINIVILGILTIFSTANAKPPSRILRGSDAFPGEFPYIVSLRRWNIHVCGGALISRRHVLTAAHCFIGRVDPPYTEELVIITGASTNRAIGQVQQVKKVTPHNDFERGSTSRWRHDIAIVTLENEIVESNLQKPIALPTEDTPGNVSADLCGWGVTLQNGEESESLKKTKVNILTNNECNERDTRILETQMCGFNGRQTGFCNGDSGSPLVYNDQVVGIVSFSISCGLGYPDTYTRVYKYLDFIGNATKD
ncbi:chymotrypsin-2-like isoform X2 [Chelonus insularis]|nr:chymotrypsin-2-like isoform X2 [Chelonus insularis]